MMSDQVVYLVEYFDGFLVYLVFVYVEIDCWVLRIYDEVGVLMVYWFVCKILWVIVYDYKIVVWLCFRGYLYVWLVFYEVYVICLL